ncbi:MAG: response regulator SirA [Spartobacteria bacterium]|nr:response regulator SirA [Spartobacteria bacterium]
MTSACSVKQIIKRDGTVVPYDRDRITTAIFNAATSVGGSDRETAEYLAKCVEKSLNEIYIDGSTPSVEDIQDVVEEILINKDHATTARAFIIYRHERARQREARAVHVEASDNIPYKKIYEVLRWNMDHRCETVEGINRIIANGNYPQLVHDCNERYYAEVARGAEQIIERLPAVRMVIIAGPSSSGKTTTMIKMSEKLKEAGINKLVGINIDHYFFDLEMHPKDEFGDYDYETPEALDLPLINQHLEQLLNGETIKTPHYDFKTGTRELNVHELRLEDDQILLIDSLHGLYDAMTSSIPRENKFRLYIETLGQVQNMDGVFMRWADNRLMRRMIRDSWHRNLKPLQTLTHWHYVRRSELKYIIPFIGNVDYLVNSALPYELPILKNRLFKNFPEGMALYRDDPKRQDAYIRAKRVFEFLDPMTEMADDSAIPDNALLREFIGGSTYKY